MGFESSLSGLNYLVDGFGVVLVFQSMDMGFDFIKGFGAVAVEGELVDNLPCVDTFVNKVDSDAEHAHTVVESILNAVSAGEGGQQGGMKVDDAHGIVGEEHLADVAHVTGQDDIVHVAVLQLVQDGGLVGALVGVLLGAESERVNTIGIGAFHCFAIRLVGDQQGDFRLERPLLYGFDDGLEIRAEAGSENCDFFHRRLLAFTFTLFRAFTVLLALAFAFFATFALFWTLFATRFLATGTKVESGLLLLGGEIIPLAHLFLELGFLGFSFGLFSFLLVVASLALVEEFHLAVFGQVFPVGPILHGLLLFFATRGLLFLALCLCLAFWLGLFFGLVVASG